MLCISKDDTSFGFSRHTRFGIYNGIFWISSITHLIINNSFPPIQFRIHFDANSSIDRSSSSRLLPGSLFENWCQSLYFRIAPVTCHQISIAIIRSASILFNVPGLLQWNTQKLFCLTKKYYSQRSRSSLTCTGSERSNSNRFNCTIKLSMISGKEFIVIQVTWSTYPEKGNNQPSLLSTNTSCRLNISRGCFGLSMYNHQSQAIHVHSSTKHRRRKNRILFPIQVKSLQQCREVKRICPT